MDRTFAWMDTMCEMAGKIDEQELSRMRQAGATLDILDYLRGMLGAKG
jgi:hypothetical protein